MKKKTTMMAGLAMTMLVGVVGCESTKEEPAKPAFTAKEETAFMTKYQEKLLKPVEPKVIIKELDTNIERMSKQGASNAVDGLLYVIHQANAEMNTKSQGLQEAFKEVDKDGFDFHDDKSINTVEDETFKAYLKELKSKMYVVSKIGENYSVKPDIKAVLDGYGKYMNDDLKAIVKFSIQENEKPFFNTTTNSFDMEVVVQRILKIEDNMKKFPKSFYQSSMENTKNYYYQVYFGTNSSFLVDKNKEVLSAVLTNYKETVEKHPDSQLAKDITLFMNKLKGTKNIVTDDVMVFLIDLTNTPTEEVTQEPATKNEKANADVDDAVKKAIEDNTEKTENVEAKAEKTESTEAKTKVEKTEPVEKETKTEK